MYDKKEGYGGKKKLAKWVLIYLVIGALVYGVVYYFFLSPAATGQTSSSPYSTTK